LPSFLHLEQLLHGLVALVLLLVVHNIMIGLQIQAELLSLIVFGLIQKLLQKLEVHVLEDGGRRLLLDIVDFIQKLKV